MEKFWLIAREIGISLLIIALVVTGGFFLFKESYPSGLEVPEAKQYVKLKREDYKVVGDIQNAQNPTEIFATTSPELDLYQTEIRYVTGSVNPFVSEGSQTDLPTEVVSTSPTTVTSGDKK